MPKPRGGRIRARLHLIRLHWMDYSCILHSTRLHLIRLQSMQSLLQSMLQSCIATEHAVPTQTMTELLALNSTPNPITMATWLHTHNDHDGQMTML